MTPPARLPCPPWKTEGCDRHAAEDTSPSSTPSPLETPAPDADDVAADPPKVKAVIDLAERVLDETSPH